MDDFDVEMKNVNLSLVLEDCPILKSYLGPLYINHFKVNSKDDKYTVNIDGKSKSGIYLLITQNGIYFVQDVTKTRHNFPIRFGNIMVSLFGSKSETTKNIIFHIERGAYCLSRLYISHNKKDEINNKSVNSIFYELPDFGGDNYQNKNNNLADSILSDSVLTTSGLSSVSTNIAQYIVLLLEQERKLALNMNLPDGARMRHSDQFNDQISIISKNFDQPGITNIFPFVTFVDIKKPNTWVSFMLEPNNEEKLKEINECLQSI
ncbi:MAG: hypothetical protein NTX79_02020 [Candidatus Micrarchaeota archaeon]|nr:hypothetical protein [Candidatus Micrarchaeota archaeon]